MALSEPLRPSLLFWYGQLLMLFKRHTRALEVFRTVARENPRHPQAWTCVAFLLAEPRPVELLFVRQHRIEPRIAAGKLDVAHAHLGQALDGIGNAERRSDVLVAFRVVRFDNDGSAIIAWKLLKSFSKPQLNR